MIDASICAFCEYWDCAADLTIRDEALRIGLFKECKFHFPAVTQGKDTCIYYKRLGL